MSVRKETRKKQTIETMKEEINFAFIKCPIGQRKHLFMDLKNGRKMN